MRRLAICLVALALTTSLACRGGTNSSTEPPAPLQVTQASEGKTVTVKPGQSVQVTLRGNPSTGYVWAQVKRKGGATQPGLTITQVGGMKFQADKNMPGSPGTVTLTFKVNGTGRDALVLGYGRPWEKNTAPTTTFTVTLVSK